MVYLSKIYTKTGDSGQTSLGDGSKVDKDDSRIEAIGTVDELSSILGILHQHCEGSPHAGLFHEIRNDLFDVGGDLCIPVSEAESPGKNLRITDRYVEKLERAIDEINGPLEPLTSFVLPGGTTVAAWCHLARSVCRRAERRVVTAAREHPINPVVLTYLNRLSDLLFVLARSSNDLGQGDVLWQPGRNG